MTEIQDTRSLASRKNISRALTAREQLALTILADEWSKAELKMCFEVNKPLVHTTDLSQQSVREIARFERERVIHNADD